VNAEFAGVYPVLIKLNNVNYETGIEDFKLLNDINPNPATDIVIIDSSNIDINVSKIRIQRVNFLSNETSSYNMYKRKII